VTRIKLNKGRKVKTCWRMKKIKKERVDGEGKKERERNICD
jgi:hypothetical protein